jgi:dihydroorotate dehydrogenase
MKPVNGMFATSGRLATAALRMLPSEMAHDIGLTFLKSPAGVWLGRLVDLPADESLRVEVRGLGELNHPIGLAAGFDKNAVALPALAGLGFSFIEVGAVTPYAQPGNPRPRLFRMAADRALVNRMGFNNDGAPAVGRRISSFRAKLDSDCNQRGFPVGVNLGKNKDTPPDSAIQDYWSAFAATKDGGSFFVVNISSPNTPGLRQLATPEFLRDLATGFGIDLNRVWVKFDPDMDREKFQQLIQTVGDAGYAGVVLSNTHRVEGPEAGGLSGKPLFALANRTLEWAWEVHRGAMATIGVGGVMSGEDAFRKVALGADAIQIYTAFVYEGPWVVARIANGLLQQMQKIGLKSLRDARGIAYFKDYKDV